MQSNFISINSKSIYELDGKTSEGLLKSISKSILGLDDKISEAFLRFLASVDVPPQEQTIIISLEKSVKAGAVKLLGKSFPNLRLNGDLSDDVIASISLHFETLYITPEVTKRVAEKLYDNMPHISLKEIVFYPNVKEDVENVLTSRFPQIPQIKIKMMHEGLPSQPGAPVQNPQNTASLVLSRLQLNHSDNKSPGNFKLLMEKVSLLLRENEFLNKLNASKDETIKSKDESLGLLKASNAEKDLKIGELEKRKRELEEEIKTLKPKGSEKKRRTLKSKEPEKKRKTFDPRVFANLVEVATAATQELAPINLNQQTSLNSQNKKTGM